jgi:hypothetical protein
MWVWGRNYTINLNVPETYMIKPAEYLSTIFPKSALGDLTWEKEL